MSDLQEMYEKERAKWDNISREKLGAAAKQELKIEPGDDFYSLCERDTVMVGVEEFLGELSGKDVLEVGCGSGKMASLLAKTEAHVVAFDLSPVSIQVAQARMSINNLQPWMRLVTAAGEHLPFADNSFDVIFGRAILHHLDVQHGNREIHRVLKPKGKAVFVEPMGMNPLLNLVRDYVPYPQKNPVGDDKPLNYKEIRAWGSLFRHYTYQEVHLLGMIERGFGYKRRVRLPLLHQLDKIILKTLPFMGRFYRYVVMYMEK